MRADDFFALRRCLKEPIPDIWSAAAMLDEAVDAHLAGDRARAAALLNAADLPAIAAWTESIWGGFDHEVHRVRKVSDAPPVLPLEARPKPRMPARQTCAAVLERDGYLCRFCGGPLVSADTRRKMAVAYPDALRWGPANADQHAAFQCMWLQFDHVLPNSRGGESSIDNVVVTCGPCNYGRREWTVEEVGLIDPRSIEPSPRLWDGLARFP